MAEENKNLDIALDILNLANTALPGILKLINMIKDADPGMTVGEMKPLIDGIFTSNRDMIAEWKAKHPERSA